jgi:hypothetical protein
MSNKFNRDGRDTSRRLLGSIALTIACIGLVKFLGLMVQYGPAQSPWLFLLVFVPTFLVGRLLLPTHPRVAAAIIAAFATLLVAITTAALIAGVEPYWADYLFVFVGAPLALAAVGLAAHVLAHASESPTRATTR